MHRNLRATVLLFGLIACQSAPLEEARASQNPGAAYSNEFWALWSDGKAELAGYSIETSRYGEKRVGQAVAIFVTETLAHQSRVKTNRPQDGSHYPVMKLNLSKDFQTGIYDYNTMLSAFVALTPNDHLPVGHISKVSFSSQEWCGHVYHQLLFDRGEIQETSHSYFQDEADQNRTFKSPPRLMSEDAILLWARGMSGPRLKPGEQAIVPMINSLYRARLDHVKLQTTRATLARHPEKESITTPAGTFSVNRYAVNIEGGQRWVILVEDAFPHRVITWENSSGERAELQGVIRETYWSKQKNKDTALLHKLGLTPITKPKTVQNQ
jgi:hypothetical protein